MAANEPADESVDSPSTGRVGRRTFLRTVLGEAAVMASGMGLASRGAPASTAGGRSVGEASEESVESTRTRLLGGGRLVVGEAAFDTIEDAWAEAESGDTIYVHSSYDAAAVRESFPIRLDFREKEVTLTGGHPSGSVIDASHTDRTVIEVVGAGPKEYTNNPVVRNLRIVGGDVGLKISSAPFSTYENIVFDGTGSHGVELTEFDADGTPYGTFGTTFTNCQAWGCDGNGFHLNRDAVPHGTTFAYCKATACGGHGFRLRGTSVRMFACGTQLNYGLGIIARGGFNSLLQSVYVEGNARGSQHEDAPSEIEIRRTDGFTVENCYFHGIYPRGSDHEFDRVQRGITARNAHGLSLRNCTVRRYGRGFVALDGCRDPDIHRPSHVIRETQLFGGPTGIRTRSDGVVLPGDLSSVDGAYEGDMGYHLGDEHEGLAVWRRGRWHLAETTTL